MDERAMSRIQAESDDASGINPDRPTNAASEGIGGAARGSAGEGLSRGAAIGYDGAERTFEGDGRHRLDQQSSTD